jgi:hypothetical protein
MKAKWTLWALLPLCLFSVGQAHAVEVAVMPVKGVNLSPGECDAIGVLFASAYSRDAHVAVASPAQTRALAGEGKTSAAIAEELGAANFVVLGAIRQGRKVSVAGSLFARDGRPLFRAEITAPNLETMDAAIGVLARALVWRQPIPAGPTVEAATDDQAVPVETPPEPVEAVDPNASRKAIGPKGAIWVPYSQGRKFSPMVSVAFDVRYGPPNYFVEFALGIAGPIEDYDYSSKIRVTSGYLEIGGGYYLSEGNTGIYVGAGLSPAIWDSKVGYDSHVAATCSVHGQFGMTFRRDSRTRIFAEARLSQLLLSVSDPVPDSTGYSTTTSAPYHPAVLSVQAGVGW